MELPEPNIDSLLLQIKHAIKVGGIESVGIANDYSIRGQSALAKIGNNNAEGVYLGSIGNQDMLSSRSSTTFVVCI